ncbi:MAG: DNA polymerase III subunit delta [Deltaproteobacteria bacterium]|nr:DNA polymerase III subunit delta [Deltaproteobacteria bacterium]
MIFGEEDYLVRDAAEKIVNAILPSLDRDWNFFVMEGEQENLDHLCTSLLTPSLIAGEKVIWVKNTQIFYSRQNVSDLIEKIRLYHDQDPSRAARDFGVFLGITGLQMDDLINGGWEKISDDQWLDMVGVMESAESRNAWLSKIVTYSHDHELTINPPKNRTDILHEVLSRGIPSGNHLILTAGSVDKRKKIYKTIVERGIVLEFTPSKAESQQRTMVMEMARDRLAASGKKMAPLAWTGLGRKTGFSLRESMEALEKLISYTGDRSLIQEGDVEEIIGKTKEDQVFDLTAPLIKKDLGAALMSLDELLERGMNPLQILAMLVREVRLLLHGKIYATSDLFTSFDNKMDYNRFQKNVYPDIKKIAAAKGKGGKHLAGMHPYVIYNTLKNADRFSTDNLISYLEELASIDMVFKTTARDPKLLLERFIVRFCS